MDFHTRFCFPVFNDSLAISLKSHNKYLFRVNRNFVFAFYINRRNSSIYLSRTSRRTSCQTRYKMAAVVLMPQISFIRHTVLLSAGNSKRTKFGCHSLT
jgi:hypothetical protein